MCPYFLRYASLKISVTNTFGIKIKEEMLSYARRSDDFTYTRRQMCRTPKAQIIDC